MHSSSYPCLMFIYTLYTTISSNTILQIYFEGTITAAYITFIGNFLTVKSFVLVPHITRGEAVYKLNNLFFLQRRPRFASEWLGLGTKITFVEVIERSWFW